MKVVLDAPIGGLGDALLFSTLPELYAKHGFDVFVTPRTIANCRNPEVADLLYHRNPYIDGQLEASEANEVAGIKHERRFFMEARFWRNPIGLIEALHNFDPHNDRPMIHYTPVVRKDCIDSAVIDPYSVSQHFPDDVFERYASRLIADDDHAVVLESKFHSGRSVLPQLPRYKVADIYEYIDIVAAARKFIGTESGSQSIAAAVREDDTYALCTAMHMNSRLYVWPNVNYTVTGKLSDDYLWNDATAEHVGMQWAS